MNRSALPSILAGFLCVSAAQVHAADTHLSVTGTLTPSACDISFPDGDTFSLGTVSLASLNPSGSTVLPSMEASLRVECSGPTTVALTVASASEPPGSLGQLHHALRVGPTAMFGIDWNGRPVGAYTLRLIQGAQFGDGEPTSPLLRHAELSWQAQTSVDTISQHPALRMLYAWGPDRQPGAYRSIEARLRIQTAVIDRSQLAAAGGGDELTLEDQVIFKLAYL